MDNCKPMTEKQIICSKINFAQNLLKDESNTMFEIKQIIKLLQDVKCDIRKLR